MSAWSETKRPLRLFEKERPKEDKTPKAISCYGLYLPKEQQQMLLRFVEGRPVSGLTCQFLAWACQRLEAAGSKVLLLIWDNAAWHKSAEMRTWLRAYNRQAKARGGLRLLIFQLPSRSPWLNAIEPKWVHGKRAVVEPERVLSAEELTERICRYYDCEQLPKLEQELS
jgi:transposase